MSKYELKRTAIRDPNLAKVGKKVRRRSNCDCRCDIGISVSELVMDSVSNCWRLIYDHCGETLWDKEVNKYRVVRVMVDRETARSVWKKASKKTLFERERYSLQMDLKINRTAVCEKIRSRVCECVVDPETEP